MADLRNSKINVFIYPYLYELNTLLNVFCITVLLELMFSLILLSKVLLFSLFILGALPFLNFAVLFLFSLTFKGFFKSDQTKKILGL